MHGQIRVYYEHCNMDDHVAIDTINMAGLNLFKEKRFSCIEHICVYLLCTCDHSFHVGVGGENMQLMEHHIACNVFGKVYI